MRKTLFLCLFGCSWLCQAQNETSLSRPVDSPLPFSRNAWLVGFQVGYSKGTYGQERYSATHAYGGYFVADKVALGLAATWGRESFGATQDMTISGGPMIRYQFTRTRFSPFIVGAYQFGQATVSGLKSTTTPGMSSADSQERPIQSGYVGLGMSVGVIGSYRLDLLLTWQDKPGAVALGQSGRYNLLQAQLGVNYLLNKKRRAIF